MTHEDGSYVELTYDAALRIESETYRRADDTLLTRTEYTYDADGNRRTRTVDGAAETYEYASGSRLTEVQAGGSAVATFGYDDGGRVTSLRRAGQNLDLTWDSMDHVVNVHDVDAGPGADVAWAFDGAGRRTGRTANGVARSYLVAPNGNQGLESPQLVVDDAGVVERGYVFEGEHPIARWGVAGVPEYYLEDGIRSVVGVVDDAGGVVDTYAYDSFGVARGGSAEPEGFGFQGMWRDADGTYFVRARVYDTRTGRFLSRDPAEGEAANPVSYSAYGFAGQNPWTGRDPTGERTMVQLMASIQAHAAIIGTALAGVRPMLNRAAVVAGRLNQVQLHHALPKFLGGANVQRLVGLSQPLHAQLHRIIRFQLRLRGLPYNQWRSAADFSRNALRNPRMLRQAWDAVLEASREVDMLYGTNVTSHVWQAFYDGDEAKVVGQLLTAWLNL